MRQQCHLAGFACSREWVRFAHSNDSGE